jgi:hypothetical protein
MAYKCPRCGEPVQRAHSTGAQIAGGVVGAMIYAAFGSFSCKKCGKIARSEFPPEDQSKMTTNSVFMVIGAVVVFIAVVAILVAIRS